MEPVYITLLILLYSVIMFVSGLIPMSAVAVGVPVLLVLTGVLGVKDAFSGFIDKNVLMFAGMFVVGSSVLTSGLALRLGKMVLSKIKSERMLLLAVCLCAIFLSMFLNNTATIALLIPIICGLCEEGGYNKSKFMMPAAFSTSLGGMCTLIGTPPNSIVKGMLEIIQPDSLIGFFEYAKIGIPICVCGILLFLFSFNKSLGESSRETVTTATVKTDKHTHSKRKEIITALVFICVISLMMLENQVKIPMYISALCGALVLIITRTVSEKEAIASLEINTLLLMGGMLSLASALTESGAAIQFAEKCAELAENVPVRLAVAVIFVLSCFLTLFMSNTATASVVAPIAAGIASTLNINVKLVMAVTAIGASCAFLTPIATPPNTMVMSYGGYSFKDYFKLGLPLTLLSFLLIVMFAPTVWG